MINNGERHYTFGQDIGKMYWKKNELEDMDEEDPSVTETRQRALRIKTKNNMMQKDNLYDSYWGKHNK